MALIENGGFFIWPIIGLSILSVWFLIDRGVFFWYRIPRINKNLDAICQQQQGKGELPNGVKSHVLGRIRHAIEERKLDPDLLDLAVEQDLIQAERKLTGLSVISQIAPLMGLLGTVTGMINTFKSIENASEVTPSVLAGGIWEALLTTAAGLVVAIPALVGYLYFRNRAARWENLLRMAVTHANRAMARIGMEVR